jgi:hypothetical protein
MLFNQSKAELPERKPDESSFTNLWARTCGDLAMDSRLLGDQYTAPAQELKYDERARFALERMRQMNHQMAKKDKDLIDMAQTLDYMKNSKLNLNNELKKLLEHNRELHKSKDDLAEKCQRVQGTYEQLWGQMAAFSIGDGLEALDVMDLEDLEQFMFRTIDRVKNVRIKKIVEAG